MSLKVYNQKIQEFMLKGSLSLYVTLPQSNTPSAIASHKPHQTQDNFPSLVLQYRKQKKNRTKMVSFEILEHNSSSSHMILDQQQQQTTSCPRISFSSELLDDTNFISIIPKNQEKNHQKEQNIILERDIKNRATTRPEFDFLSSNNNFGVHQTMLTADELFFEGKLLPFRQMHYYTERLNKITLQSNNQENEETEREEEILMEVVKTNASTNTKTDKNPLEGDQKLPRISSGSSNNGGGGGVSWFVDDDPSPRPPKCIVLWKELLRLKKQQRAASRFSPSSSSSTSSSSSSLVDAVVAEEKERRHKCSSNNNVKRVKKGLERTRSASISIRPMVNVPICAHQVRSCTTKKSTTLPPFFPLGLDKKGRSLEK